MTHPVYTADVCLHPESVERFDALAEIRSAAEKEEAEVLTSGGDLFDQLENDDQFHWVLRPEYLSDLPYEVLHIPGNHDVEAYRGDFLFGDSISVMVEPSSHFPTWTSEEFVFRWGIRQAYTLTQYPFRQVHRPFL